jgi:hypothetical protein
MERNGPHINNAVGCRHGQRRRAGLGRAGVVAAAMASIALLAAACSGSASSTAAGTSTYQTPYQQAFAYAQCMRSHGYPSFPDPDSQGGFNLTGAEVGNINSPQYLRADNACKHLLPTTTPQTAAQQHRLVIQALKEAACMRSHGFPSFLDPTMEPGAVIWHLPGIDQGSPQYQSAWQTCQKLYPLPGGGS